MTTHDPDKNDILPGVPASAETLTSAETSASARTLASAKASEETPERATGAEADAGAGAGAGAGADASADNDVDPNAPYQRRIRSFVLREGRMTSAQQRAFDDHWARFGLGYTGTPRDLDETFGRNAPRVLEIGFGNGEALAWASENDLARDYIGVEVHSPGVGRVMNALAARDAHNVRVYKHDAVEVLEHEIAPGSLSEVRIWFPDPWHKKRHNKRRLVQPAFVERLASRMAPGGLLHLATDWEAYAEHMRETMEAATGWKNRVGPGAVAEKPDWRIETHFERRGTRLGHGVWDFLYEWHGA